MSRRSPRQLIPIAVALLALLLGLVVMRPSAAAEITPGQAPAVEEPFHTAPPVHDEPTGTGQPTRPADPPQTDVDDGPGDCASCGFPPPN
ncbi:hypothetical protein [Jidongwangia harbinensis]|uniref:hypothetical protein n=1 Tax=Jidongwangia harbinensis TaxID=2878561 RepID=UPI001CDA3BF4|nr:hypothetical protein [Jidongwangia harbinensis]MCA2213802.1 hypothetical protein [Jidongwangia harbinensis]